MANSLSGPAVADSPGGSGESIAEADRIRRVVVCIGAAGVDNPALQLAAGLALGLRATLAGMYVEDEQLRRMAALPFTREFGFVSACARDFSSTDLKRSQQVQIGQLRRLLAALAEPLALVWTLDVIQGELQAAPFTHATDSDLMVMGRPQLTPAPGSSTASRARQLHPAALARHPIAVLHDGSDAGRRALQTALSLVRITGSELIVLIAANDAETFQQRQADTAGGLGTARARIRRIPATDLAAAMQAAVTHGATALIRPRRHNGEAEGFPLFNPAIPACSLVLIP